MKEKIKPVLKKLLSASFMTPILSIVIALFFGAIFLYSTGYNPFSVYFSIFRNAFTDSYGLSATLLKAIPLVLCALAVAICLKASVWNIGAEGQYLLGCIGAGWVVYYLGDMPSILLLPTLLLAGFLTGAIWAGIAGVLKSRFDVNEILTTLLMNYIAISFIEYLVYGPWRDEQAGNFPYTPLFPEKACLPPLRWGNMHMGFTIAIAMTIVVYFVIKYTRFGFEIRIIGDSPKAAEYAGISVKKTMFLTMLFAGGMAGLAGAVEIAGLEHKLNNHLSKGNGYTAIIIAWLAGKHPLYIIPVAILIAGLHTGGEIAEITHKIPKATVDVLQGIILLLILLSGTIKNTLQKIEFKKMRSDEQAKEQK